jgi:AcrR family transcriptional regulator
MKRRMGPENSASRTALMDAVEALMRERGYAALTARAVAARAGLKYQLVFYYFETMDDLLLATYRRNAEVMWDRVQAALDAERPLHAFWKVWSDPFDGAVSLEYMAMSNHNPAIRAEKVAFGERVRKLVGEKLTLPLAKATPEPAVFTPFAISMLLASIGSILAFEDTLGITGGHSETRVLLDWCLSYLEPETAEAAPAV